MKLNDVPTLELVAMYEAARVSCSGGAGCRILLDEIERRDALAVSDLRGADAPELVAGYQASTILGCSARRLARMQKAGHVPYYQLPSGDVVYDRRELLECLAQWKHAKSFKATGATHGTEAQTSGRDERTKPRDHGDRPRASGRHGE